MAGFIKEGGLLMTILPWTSRYHAEDTYGHYTQLSARALEKLCIDNGLNPVRSGYDHHAQNGENKDGVRNHNVLDRMPYIWPGRSEFNSFVICYKPRRGERRVLFEEVGHLPAELHPRFELRFDASLPGSEEPRFASSVANHFGLSMVARAKILSPSVSMKHTASVCDELMAGDLAISLEQFHNSSVHGKTNKPRVLKLQHGIRGKDLDLYEGPTPYVTLENGLRYRVGTVGRC